MARSKFDVLAKGKHLQLLNDGGWEYADRVRGSGVVAVIATTEANELILTEQYRPPVKKKVIDLTAGLAGDVDGQESEAFEQAAQRELEEETGYTANHFEYVFTGPSSAGMTTEMIAFYRAKNATRIGAGGGDDSEEIKVHVIPMKKVYSWLKLKETSRTCVDPKVYAALGVLSFFDEQ